MADHTEEFLRVLQHPLKFRLFLLYKLPSAFFAGVRLQSVTRHSCKVTIPYKWFSQNPFRSTYFACLGMAAEMSTGALAMAHLHKRLPPVSLLVTRVDGDFIKKAIGVTTFTCNDGQLIADAITTAIASGEGTKVTARSTGRNKDGDVVAEFLVSWSFKVKSPGKPERAVV